MLGRLGVISDGFCIVSSVFSAYGLNTLVRLFATPIGLSCLSEYVWNLCTCCRYSFLAESGPAVNSTARICLKRASHHDSDPTDEKSTLIR